MENIKNTITNDNKIEFNEIVRLFLEKSSFIILSILLSFFLGIIISLSLPNKYTAVSLLEVNNEDSNSAMSSLSGQLGGFGNIAGISLSNDASKGEYAIALIKSKEMLQHLLTFDGVRENLFAAKSFNKLSKEIIYDSKIYNADKNIWNRKVKGNMSNIPSFQEIHKEIIAKQLNVSIDRRSGFVSISFTHISPVFAKYFIDLIVTELNTIARLKDLNLASEALDFYEKKLSDPLKTELKESINKLIEVELQKEMLSSVRKDYLLIPIDSAYIPEKKSSPQRALIVILSTLIGLISSLSYILFRRYIL